MRVLQSTTAKVALPVTTDLDEIPTTAGTAIAVTATTANGSALAGGTITVSSADSTRPGVYYATLSATHTANLNVLTLTTTATVSSNTQTFVQSVEVVGAHYVTIADIRALPGMADVDKFPTALLRQVRDQFEDMVESITGTAWVPRFARVSLDGDGSNALVLPDLHPRTVVSVTIDGTSCSASDFTLYEEGLIRRESTTFPAPSYSTGPRNVVVEYTHGHDAPPAQLREEALSWIRYKVMQRLAGVQSNAIAEDNTRYSTPDPANGRPTGSLTLDPILVDLNEKRPAIG